MWLFDGIFDDDDDDDMDDMIELDSWFVQTVTLSVIYYSGVTLEVAIFLKSLQVPKYCKYIQNFNEY